MGLLPRGDELEHKASFRSFSEQVGSEERSENIEITSVTLLAIEKLLVRDAVADIPVHVEKAVIKLVLETLNASRRDIKNLLSEALKTWIFHNVKKVLSSTEFVSRFQRRHR